MVKGILVKQVPLLTRLCANCRFMLLQHKLLQWQWRQIQKSTDSHNTNTSTLFVGFQCYPHSIASLFSLLPISILTSLLSKSTLSNQIHSPSNSNLHGHPLHQSHLSNPLSSFRNQSSPLQLPPVHFTSCSLIPPMRGFYLRYLFRRMSFTWKGSVALIWWMVGLSVLLSGMMGGWIWLLLETLIWIIGDCLIVVGWFLIRRWNGLRRWSLLLVVMDLVFIGGIRENLVDRFLSLRVTGKKNVQLLVETWE